LKRKLTLQVLVSISLAFFAGFLGFRYGVSSHQKDNTHLGGHWKSDRGSRASSDKCLDEDRFVEGRSPASEGHDTEYFSVLEKNHLEEKSRKMMGIFPRTEIGHALAQATTLSQFGPSSHTHEGRVVEELLKLLESEPHRTYTLIRSSVDRLSTDYTRERQFLYLLVARLDIETEGKIDFFLGELAKATSGGDSKANRLNSAVILLKLMQLENDSSLLGAALRQIFQEQTNYSLRSYLLSIYESKYPEEARKMRSDFGINETL
jgi:hypothetical protein